MGEADQLSFTIPSNLSAQPFEWRLSWCYHCLCISNISADILAPTYRGKKWSVTTCGLWYLVFLGWKLMKVHVAYWLTDRQAGGQADRQTLTKLWWTGAEHCRDCFSLSRHASFSRWAWLSRAAEYRGTPSSSQGARRFFSVAPRVSIKLTGWWGSCDREREERMSCSIYVDTQEEFEAFSFKKRARTDLFCTQLQDIVLAEKAQQVNLQLWRT